MRACFGNARASSIFTFAIGNLRRTASEGRQRIGRQSHNWLLNGEEVNVESTEADRLGNPGKAWLEFAKGKDGVYWDIDKTVAVHRVLDAALTSVQEGRRVSLS